MAAGFPQTWLSPVNLSRFSIIALFKPDTGSGESLVLKQLSSIEIHSLSEYKSLDPHRTHPKSVVKGVLLWQVCRNSDLVKFEGQAV